MEFFLPDINLSMKLAPGSAASIYFTRHLTAQVLHAQETPSSKQRVVDKHEHDRAHHRYQSAVEIHTRIAGLPKQIRKKPANKCPDDTQQTIATQTVTSLVENLAGEEPHHQTQNDPDRKRQS